MRILNEQLQHPSPQQVAAWMMKYRNWPEKDLNERKPLKVYFMNNCPGEWKYQGKCIDADLILEIVQSSWRGCFTTSRSMQKARIRVRFKGIDPLTITLW